MSSRVTKGDGKGASGERGNWKSTVPGAKERSISEKYGSRDLAE